MCKPLRGFVPSGFFVACVLSLTLLGACNNDTTSPEMSARPTAPRMFTGADSVYIAALEARVAKLEEHIAITSGEQIQMRVGNAEVLQVQNPASGSRGARITGALQINRVFSTDTGATLSAPSPVYFGSSGFDRTEILDKNNTTLRVQWAKANLLSGYTYPVAQVIVGEANSAGTGFRLLKVGN